MIHLKSYKIFESLAQYSKIEHPEYYKMFEGLITMNQKYIDVLLDLLGSKNVAIHTKGVKQNDKSIKVCNYIYFPFKYKRREYNNSIYTSNECRVYEAKDEYFLVEVNNEGYYDYYQCDQFDSLLKLLKDLDITTKPFIEIL